jgi:hypothetical protein
MGIFNHFQKKTAPIQQGFKEKRQVPRWKISTPAKIKLIGCNDYLACEIKDLNLKGFCLLTSEKIPEECAGFELYFNDNYLFGIGITISWYKEMGKNHIYGMKFTKLRDQDKERIFQMMQERFPTHFRSNL